MIIPERETHLRPPPEDSSPPRHGPCAVTGQQPSPFPGMFPPLVNYCSLMDPSSLSPSFVSPAGSATECNLKQESLCPRAWPCCCTSPCPGLCCNMQRHLLVEIAVQELTGPALILPCACCGQGAHCLILPTPGDPGGERGSYPGQGGGCRQLRTTTGTSVPKMPLEGPTFGKGSLA